MARVLLIVLSIVCSISLALPESVEPTTASPEPRAEEPDAEEPPEGYYAFVESPNATPPRVRPPPYRQTASECPEAGESRPHVSATNLCGDLNRGTIPRNPMGQNPLGEPYPFELIRNQTLRFLSRTLPVLRADDTLPRVAHLPSPPAGTADTPHADTQHADTPQPELIGLNTNELEKRHKRSAESAPESASSALPAEHRADDAPRESRKFCDNGGVFCMLYRAINGESDSSAGGVERREDPGPRPLPQQHRYEGPPTPCPARVEYATPVFARNYQGVWRYVVQIPYEGYFTQTVEVTRCMQSRCHYLDGGCLSSPRWVSLLVAELHYPPAGGSQYQEYQQVLQKRAGLGVAEGAGTVPGAGAGTGGAGTGGATHCDGHDELGCFQVRLYYDWFLVPGSCKCWRPDYFARYVRRRQNNNEL